MANPNLSDFVDLYPKRAFLAPTTTMADLLVNTGGSGKALVIKSIFVANIDGSNDCHVTLVHDDGTTEHAFVHQINVAAGSTFKPIEGSDGMVLLEGDSLRAQAEINSDLQITVYYDEVS
jgi:hypothetical protein